MVSATKAKVVVGFASRIPLLPLAILRLVAFSRATRSSERLFDFVIPAVYLQAEMCYSLISATIPCLRIFLQAASSQFLLGENYIDPLESALATAGSTKAAGSSGKGGSAGNSTQRRRPRGIGKGESFKLSNLSGKNNRESDGINFGTNKTRGETITEAGRAGGADKISIASDSSRKAIVVRQTVNVQYGD
ncbi:hypothetical protein LTR37_002133 [Vermiconidia calcicola]|uniref:Uncharacterized protein n=1 Tax=Vermiconidia calcicola TaxID=1690605 RepID=A0ACC3NTP9_9PEZI|nr:hypothetical protein LTR37_002133 [Vermiconidia calcicola]